MAGRIFRSVAAIVFCMVLTVTLVLPQTPAGGTQPPDWFLQSSAADPGGRAVVAPGGRVISTGSAAPRGVTPPQGGGGVSAVKIDSKGNLWVFQRNAIGNPQLFEFGPELDGQARKLIRTVGDDVIGHQEKAHGMAIDAEDNVWICDANGGTVMKLSPEGKLLMTLGVKRKRGDWNEARGQRLLWQPLDLVFATNGDIYIGEGHANESPNDAGSDDPANNIGAARVIHLDKNGKFINQWYGNSIGQGKFSMVHGIAVDPTTAMFGWVTGRSIAWSFIRQTASSSKPFK
jgi:hypothetical protein